MSVILYEQPLNERMRTFMRLEYFFSQATHFLEGSSQWDLQASVFAIVEILNILERSDVRSEVLKELERHTGNLSRLLETPAIDRSRLDNTLQTLTRQAKDIHALPGKLVKNLRTDDLLNSIRQRTAVSSSTCSFDIPGFYHWLHLPRALCVDRFSRWLDDFNVLQESLKLILGLTRESALFEPKTAHAGFFQKSLDAAHPCQLVRIHLPERSSVYPEISGGKHRVNVRFLSYPSDDKRPTQIKDDLDFEISCCTI